MPEDSRFDSALKLGWSVFQLALVGILIWALWVMFA